MPRVYTMLLKVTRIRLRIIATDCTWSTSVDVEVLIFRKQAQVGQRDFGESTCCSTKLHGLSGEIHKTLRA